MSADAEKIMAIIKRPKFGYEERMGVCLRFETYVTEFSAASQFLPVEQAVEVIKAYGVSDVSQLEGKSCWVDTSEQQRIKFLKPCPIR